MPRPTTQAIGLSLVIGSSRTGQPAGQEPHCSRIGPCVREAGPSPWVIQFSLMLKLGPGGPERKRGPNSFLYPPHFLTVWNTEQTRIGLLPNALRADYTPARCGNYASHHATRQEVPSGLSRHLAGSAGSFH